MTSSHTQVPRVEGTHLVLYDGVCGLCDRLVQFLLGHDRHAVFCFAPLQSATGQAIVARFGGNPNELNSFLVVANYRGDHPLMFAKSSAALFVARELGWPWKTAAAMRFLPTVIRDHVYDVIARNRYRVFGRFDQCLIPRAEFRGRFVDT
jgi:predicted DCC family thiol-disulfide oxidoreductase YuxK